MRFRSWGLRTVVAAIVIAATVPSIGRAASPVDWVFASMTVSGGAPATAPPGGGSFSIGVGSGSGASLAISGSGHSTGTGPVLIGSGTGFGGGPSFVSVYDFADGGIRLRTTTELGGLDLEITPAADGSFSFASLAGGSGSSFTKLLFVVNAVIDRYSVQGSGGTPIVDAGTGSRAIQMAGPEASGIAVDASVAAVGASTFDAVTSKGIAGGIAVGGCTRCTVDWSGPLGRSGSATQTSTPFLPLPVPVPVPGGTVEGDFTFTGPAGAWSWSWTGANVRTEPSPTIVGAYAPIGDLWRVFAGLGGGSSTGVIAQPKPQPKPEVRGAKQTRTLPATGVGTPLAAWALVAAALVLGRRLTTIG